MTKELTRRSFIQKSTLTGAALAAAPIVSAQTGGGTKEFKVALIGCGGRGSGALRQFLEACKLLGVNGKVVAIADAFQDRIDGQQKAHGLAANQCFVGYDAYKKAIASDCDFVLMATPPGFRPVHFKAAIEAGKHVFMEKPVAVDPVGARSVMETGDLAAQKGLAVMAGTQRRHQANYLGNKAAIEKGAIGDIKGGVIQWNGRIPWIRRRQDGQSNANYMARNWLNFTELSGDHIVEQHVHNIDVALWFLGKPPESALGFGGRARRETGNQFDFFSIDLDFGDGVRIHSQCRQLSGAYSRVGEVFTGTDGIVYGGGKLTGKEVEIPEYKLESGNGQVQEHVDMIKSVMAGKPVNEARSIATSSLVAVISRMSAYTGQLIRWSDVTANQKSPFYNYACTPGPLDFEKGEIELPEEVPPVPGKPMEARKPKKKNNK